MMLGENGKINETLIKDSIIEKVDINLYEVYKSICKIIYKKEFGTGFFIKLYLEGKELLCLMTNHHVIRKEMIEENELIDVYYNLEKNQLKIKLDQKERFILYNTKMDITLIEIIPDDKIKAKFFLLPNLENVDYINKKIFIVQYPNGDKLSHSHGKIKDVVDFELIHSASTYHGSSGSPIFLEGTTKVIGIHKQGNKKREENLGTLIYPFIQLLQSKKENKKLPKELKTNNDKKLNKKDSNKNIFQIPNCQIIGDQKQYNDNTNIKYDSDDKNFKGLKKIIIYENGEYYIGPLLNGLRNGKGVIYYKNGKMKYEGDFVNDKFEGYGKYIWENGDYYIGEFLNGLRNGKGTKYYKDGNIGYEGDFLNDNKDGFGKYYYPNGENYIGRYLNNKRCGKGIVYYKNGKIKYDGEFVNDKYEGFGKYVFENGNFYFGQWLKNKRHGKGVEYYKNCMIQYDGEFVDDKKEGYGKYYYENGDIYIGQFLDDNIHGKGVIYDMNGNIKKQGNFINGKIEEIIKIKYSDNNKLVLNKNKYAGRQYYYDNDDKIDINNIKYVVVLTKQFQNV